MSRHLTKLSTLLSLSALLLFAACTDHEIETKITKVTTLKSFGNDGYQIQADEIGDQPVTEYGIAYTAYFRGQGGHNMLPTVSDRKVVFDNPIVKGLNQFKGIVPNGGQTFYYYRAYAISEDGVVYGNVLSYAVGE